jgi:hypothetical protein
MAKRVGACLVWGSIATGADQQRVRPCLVCPESGRRNRDIVHWRVEPLRTNGAALHIIQAPKMEP